MTISPASRKNNTANKIIFIVGPTAIGKTGLAIKLAGRIRGEIVSADSMQAYKGMRILSQAPAAAQRKMIRHHLVGHVSADKEYSVAIFINEASRAITSILKRGHVPIVVGGSGLYVKGLVEGLFPAPVAVPEFRKRLQKYAAKNGSPKLHSKLADIDPGSASTIHPNDSRRVIRALEIYEYTGRTMTELKASTRGLKDTYDIRLFGLTAPREEIYSRIDERCDKMLTDGIVREVSVLKKKKLSKTASGVLGLKEISGYLKDEYDLEEAIKMLKMNTRRFAKRQLTWFRPDRRIMWFDVSRVSQGEIVKKMIKEY